MLDMLNIDTTSWVIEIDNEQRLALIELLKAADKKYTEGKEAPLEYWVEMLTELPSVDNGSLFKNAHRMIHGFCL